MKEAVRYCLKKSTNASLSYVFCEFCWVFKEPPREDPREGVLGRCKPLRRCRSEVLPEGAPVAAPPIIVAHEGNVEILTGAVIHVSTLLWNRHIYICSQLGQWSSRPIGGGCSALLEEVEDSTRTTKDDNRPAEYRCVDNITYQMTVSQ